MSIFQDIFTLCKGGSLTIIILLALGAAMSPASAQMKTVSKENTDCVPIGSWIAPGGGKLSGPDVIARAAKRSVVLLGEMHDNPEHHQSF